MSTYLDSLLSAQRALALATKQTGVDVDVSKSAPPEPGQVLVAIDATHAEWQDGGGGGGAASGIATTGEPVDVASSAPPEPGQVLTATDAEHAVWRVPGLHYDPSIKFWTSSIGSATILPGTWGFIEQPGDETGDITVYIVSSLDAPPVDSRFGLYVGRDVTIPVTVSVVGASQIQGTDGELGSSTTLLPGADYEWVFYHEDSAALWGLVSDTAGIAKRIAVSGGYVDVAAAAPPNPGDVLTAIDAENAEWAPPSGGSGWLTFTTDFDPADGQWIIAANATSNFLPAATAPGMHVAVYVPIGYTDVNIKCVANAFQIDRKTYDAGGQVEVRPGAWYEWVSVDFGSDIRWVPVGGSGTSARPPLEYAAPPYPDTPGALNNKWLLGSDNTALELPIQLMHGDSIAIFADVTCTVRPGNSTFLEAPDLSATVAWPTYITLAAGTYYEWIYTDTDNTWHPRQNMLPRIAVGSTFAWSANAATIAVSGIATWAASNTMTGNCTLTLSGGVDGVRGSFYVKQDAVGSRTLTLTVSGRTILRDTGVTDDNPSAGANTITAYEYEFVTIAGTASVRIRKMPLV